MIQHFIIATCCTNKRTTRCGEILITTARAKTNFHCISFLFILQKPRGLALSRMCAGRAGTVTPQYPACERTAGFAGATVKCEPLKRANQLVASICHSEQGCASRASGKRRQPWRSFVTSPSPHAPPLPDRAAA